MNAKENLIAKRVLNVLHDEDGHQFNEITIHGMIGGLAACDVVTLANVLQQLYEQRYITRVQTRFAGVLWNINPAGEAARLEM